MNRLFDKLNLRPGERRLVVLVAGVVFLVLNIWLVWPKFGELGRVQQRREVARKKLADFQAEIQRGQHYTNELKRLADQGAVVAQESQALELQREITQQAILSQVQTPRVDSTPRTTGGKTNAFFDEATCVVSFVAEEKQLVDFLFNLGARNSLIRVRNMVLQPDPPKHKLQGTITFVESFQKKSAPKLLASATPSATPAARPAPPAPRTNPPPKEVKIETKPAKEPSAPPKPPTEPAKPPKTTDVPKRQPPAPLQPPGK
jgi:hypothetical protein